MNGPKSREETPKEGSDTRRRRISHRSNIASQRTKYKPLSGILKLQWRFILFVKQTNESAA